MGRDKNHPIYLPDKRSLRTCTQTPTYQTKPWYLLKHFRHFLTLNTMAGTSPIILIFGAGPNIGQAVARTFASKDYKIALAARSLNEADSTHDQLNITSDLTNSDDVVDAFKKVKTVFGTVPSVVVYNGKSA